MKLYAVGPVEMHERTMAIGGQQVPYFRNDTFSRVVLHCEELLRKHLACSKAYRPVLLTASGTGAMEASIMNCLTPSDKALVICGGTWGERFSKLCKIHDIPYECLMIPYGETLTASLLEPYRDGGFSALLVNIHETSTGQLYDIGMLARFARECHLLFFVDAISAICADPIKVEENGIDVLIMSSQKGFALAPGLSVCMLSPRILEERVPKINPKTMYFDFKLALENAKRGQTPFTPCVGTIIEFEDMLMAIDEVGMDEWVARTGEIARDFREQIKDVPVSIPSFPLSNALTTLIFPQNNAVQVNKRLIDEYGFVLNPCGGDFATNMSRVGHIGNHSIADNAPLVAALKKILGE